MVAFPIRNEHRNFYGIRDVFKKIVIAAVIVLLTRGLVHSFVENGHASPMAQSEVDKIVAETAKKPREDLARTLVANEKSASASKISQSDLESLALALNKTYPKTSPNGIRIDRATTGPGLITYHKTMVNLSANELEINPINSASFREVFMKDACSNPGVRNFLRSGISLQTIQRDKNGVLIYDFTARPEDCG